MKATISEVKATSQIWSDVWSLWSKYYHADSTQEFWADLVKEADEIGERYNSEFVNALLFSCVNDIERRAKAEGR